MREGGERVITVPPALGYGNKKSGSIPPNSTLKFGTYQLDSGLPDECRCMLIDGISQRLNCCPSSRRTWVKLKDNHPTSKDEMGSKSLIFVIGCSISSLSCCSLFATQAMLSLLIFML